MSTSGANHRKNKSPPPHLIAGFRDSIMTRFRVFYCPQVVRTNAGGNMGKFPPRNMLIA